MWAYNSGHGIDWKVAWRCIDEYSNNVHDPLDVRDQTQSCDDIQPEEETVLEIRLNHRVYKDLGWKQHKGEYQKAVEIYICVFVREPYTKIILKVGHKMAKLTPKRA
jgi:hypothetical protein